MPSREQLENEWQQYMNEVLPNQAQSREWPIRFDHCFGRVIYDCVVGDQWNRVIDSPAYKNLSDEQLRECIDLAERIVYADDAYLRALNDLSLRYRGNLD